MGAEGAVQVLLAGGNLRLGAYRTDDAVRLATAAKRGGAHVTFNHVWIVEDMVRIAIAGGGHVTFDVTAKKWLIVGARATALPGQAVPIISVLWNGEVGMEWSGVGPNDG